MYSEATTHGYNHAVNHLFYGESAAKSFARFNRSGRHTIFHEALATGPAALPSDTWHHIRAQYLAEAFDAHYPTCLEQWREFDADIDAMNPDDELVCWFGNDFFCQVAFMFVLVRLGKIPSRNLSFVSPGGIDDDMYCFGDVPPAEMNDRLQKRTPIQNIDLQQGAIAWHLYAESNPQCLNAVFDGSIDLGPRFANILQLHAQRFPSAIDNLGTLERTILHALRDGAMSFRELFQDVSKKTREYTWGDSQIRNVCWRMATSTPALIEVVPANGQGLNDGRAGLVNTQLMQTAAGHAILDGEFCDVTRPTYWLGGCEMTDECPWRWDPRIRRIL